MADHPLNTLRKLDPVIMDHLEKTNELIYGEGVLPKKYKYLLTMAFDASHGAINGVKSLAQSAMREGASKEEIAETLRVAFHLCGVGSLYIGSLGLKDII